MGDEKLFVITESYIEAGFKPFVIMGIEESKRAEVREVSSLRFSGEDGPYWRFFLKNPDTLEVLPHIFIPIGKSSGDVYVDESEDSDYVFSVTVGDPVQTLPRNIVEQSEFNFDYLNALSTAHSLITEKNGQNLTVAAQAIRYLTRMPTPSNIFIIGEDENNEIVTPSLAEIEIFDRYNLYTEMLIRADLLSIDKTGTVRKTKKGELAILQYNEG